MSECYLHLLVVTQSEQVLTLQVKQAGRQVRPEPKQAQPSSLRLLLPLTLLTLVTLLLLVVVLVV